MKRAVVSSVVAGVLMAASAVGAQMLVPRHMLADSLPPMQLAESIPARFGEWREEEQGMSAVVNPSVEAELRKIYTQTLARTYVNRDGYRVMLSLAYGANQSDGLSMHYPEICYPAQGFEVTGNSNGVLNTPRGAIPVKRLQTNLAGQRFEPVTYWGTVGDKVAIGGINKKLVEMRYRLGGNIPDGLLFRVSSIDTDPARSFAVQERFVADLQQALPPATRLRFMGLN